MPRYAQLVMGPAGSGKVRRVGEAGGGEGGMATSGRLQRVRALQSTYCSTMLQHCEALGRAVQVVNLDPAAEFFSYPVMAGEYTLRLPGVRRELGGQELIMAALCYPRP